ncbi:MAG: hypothetical protein AB7V77_04375 [Candidatus Woesearchaeota archaeon]
MENNNLWIISIVAIVAIVGMTFMFSGNKVSYAQQGADYVYEDAEGDLAGQAIKGVSTKNTFNSLSYSNKITINDVKSHYFENGRLIVKNGNNEGSVHDCVCNSGNGKCEYSINIRDDGRTLMIGCESKDCSSCSHVIWPDSGTTVLD